MPAGAWGPRCARPWPPTPTSSWWRPSTPAAPAPTVEGVTIAADAEAHGRAGAEVAVDFTALDAARANARWCADHGVHAVIGTTGFTADDLDDLAAAFTPATAWWRRTSPSARC